MRYNPISGRFELPAGSASVDGTAINPSSIGATTRGTIAATNLALGTIYLLETDGTQIYASYNGTKYISLVSGVGGIASASTVPIAWTNGQSTGNTDLFLYRDDAANTLAQRNGTNAQESRLYATYTSSTVYERLSSKYDSGSGAFVIGTEKGASGGSARPLWLNVDGLNVLKATASGLSGPNDMFGGATVRVASYLRVVGNILAIGDEPSVTVIMEGAVQLKSVYGSGWALGFASVASDTAANLRGALDTAFSRVSSGFFGAGDGTAGNTDGGIVAKVLVTKPVAFSALPSAATVGDGARAFITDSNLSYNSLNIGSAVAGGGANSTPVVTIGGAWVCG